jgi:hypothetical protein
MIVSRTCDVTRCCGFELTAAFLPINWLHGKHLLVLVIVTTWLRPGRRGHRDSLAMGEKVRRARGMTKQNKTQNTEHRNDEGCGEMITQSSSSSPFNSSVASIQRTCERIIKCPQNRKLVLSSAIHRHPMICIYICTSRRGCVLPPSIPTANLTLARLPHSSAEELNPSKLPSRILTPPPANLSTLVPTKHLQLRLATPHRHIYNISLPSYTHRHSISPSRVRRSRLHTISHQLST